MHLCQILLTLLPLPKFGTTWQTKRVIPINLPLLWLKKNHNTINYWAGTEQLIVERMHFPCVLFWDGKPKMYTNWWIPRSYKATDQQKFYCRVFNRWPFCYLPWKFWFSEKCFLGSRLFFKAVYWSQDIKQKATI